jgi:ketosteroid isomerase-like protein
MWRDRTIGERDGMSNNIVTVEAIYAAFGRGDLPAILEKVADDIAWEYQPISTDVPWLQPRRGRDGVSAFFQALGSAVEITRFTVNAVIGHGNLVVGLCDFEGTVRATGRTVREVEEAHVWHFDDRGRAIKFRHCVDTHAHWLAWKAQA